MNYDTQIAYELGQQIGCRKQNASIFITDKRPSFQEVSNSIRKTLLYRGEDPDDMLEAVAYIEHYKPVVTQWRIPGISQGLPVHSLMWIDTPSPEKITPHVESYTEAVSVSTIIDKVGKQWHVNKSIIIYGNFNIPENVWG